MRISRGALASSLGALVVALPVAASAADPAAGKREYMQCAACHSLVAGETKTGPDLHGVFGAKAASRGKFAYSKALSASNIVWTPASMDAWLKRPTAMAPGTKMAFAGITDDKRRANLVAYLMKASS